MHWRASRPSRLGALVGLVRAAVAVGCVGQEEAVFARAVVAGVGQQLIRGLHGQVVLPGLCVELHDGDEALRAFPLPAHLRQFVDVVKVQALIPGKPALVVGDLGKDRDEADMVGRLDAVGLVKHLVDAARRRIAGGMRQAGMPACQQQ